MKLQREKTDKSLVYDSNHFKYDYLLPLKVVWQGRGVVE